MSKAMPRIENVTRKANMMRDRDIFAAHDSGSNAKETRDT